MNSSTYNTRHDYEQSVVRIASFWETFKQDIHLIHQKTLVDAPGQTFKHIGHDRHASRVPTFLMHLNGTGLSDPVPKTS